MTHIGLTGGRQKPPDPPTRVRAIAPCQIPPLRPRASSPTLFIQAETVDA